MPTQITTNSTNQTVLTMDLASIAQHIANDNGIQMPVGGEVGDVVQLTFVNRINGNVTANLPATDYDAILTLVDVSTSVSP